MTTVTKTYSLANLYAGLAEILAEAGRGSVLHWLKQPGREWAVR